VVLLALMRPCTLARNSSLIKTLFFLGPLWNPSWDPSVEALGDGEEASVVEVEVDDEGGDDAVVIPSVEVDTSGVADEAVAFSLLLMTVLFFPLLSAVGSLFALGNDTL